MEGWEGDQVLLTSSSALPTPVLAMCHSCLENRQTSDGKLNRIVFTLGTFMTCGMKLGK